MTTAAPRANGRTRAPRVPLSVPPAPEPELAPAAAATPSLDAAVLRVQASAGKLRCNADGQIQNRTYKYVTLDAVTDEVLPLLVAEDLLWKTFPTALDGEPALRYRMTHIPSGEYDEDTMLLLCDRTSQGQGSGDTYARRYALVAYLNLTVDPDDDGALANMPPPRDRYAEAEAAHAELDKNSNPESGSTVPVAPRTTAAPAQRSEANATGRQKGAINGRCAAGGLSENDQKAILQWVAGTAILERVTKAKASQVIKRLGENGAGAQAILDEIAAQALQGDERARVIALRYFEAP